MYFQNENKKKKTALTSYQAAQIWQSLAIHMNTGQL